MWQLSWMDEVLTNVIKDCVCSSLCVRQFMVYSCVLWGHSDPLLGLKIFQANMCMRASAFDYTDEKPTSVYLQYLPAVQLIKSQFLSIEKLVVVAQNYKLHFFSFSPYWQHRVTVSLLELKIVRHVFPICGWRSVHTPTLTVYGQ